MSFYARLSQWHAARLAVVQSEPVVAVFAVLVGLWIILAWAAFIVEGKAKERERRRDELVKAMCRRRCSGLRLAGLRFQFRISYVCLVQCWRVFPKPVRVAATCLFLGMFGQTLAGTWGFLPMLGTVRLKPKAAAPTLADTLDQVDATALLDRLQEYRPVGRQGYPLSALWRAYLLSYLLGLSSTNALIRRLQDDSQLRRVCGFTKLPHRTTFNRFISRLGCHRNLVEDCL